MKKSILLTITLLSILLISNIAEAVEDNIVCAIYFTKVGCPVCAQTDPVVLDEWPKKYDKLIMIEYLINEYSNALVMGEYNLEYKTGGGVPLLIFNQTDFKAGIYYPQLGGLNRWKTETEKYIESLKDNSCLLLDDLKSFEKLDLNDLLGKPSVWARGKLIVKTKEGIVSSDFLKELLLSENLEDVLKNTNYKLEEIKAEPAPISSGEIVFKKAIMIKDSWILKFNDDIKLPDNVKPLSDGENITKNTNMLNLTLLVIVLIIIFLMSVIIYKKVIK